MKSGWLTVFLLAPLINALDDSAPLVAWSSSPSEVLSSLSAQKPLVAQMDDVLGSVLTGDICGYDVVVVIEQPGLHASDLRTLQPTSHIAKQLRSASSSVHVPYLTPAGPVGLGRSLAKLCQSDVLDVDVNQDVEGLLPTTGKRVIYIDLPELHSVGPERREEMQSLESKLAVMLAKIEDIFPSHFVLLTGTTASSFNKMKRHVGRSQAALPDVFKSPRAAKISSPAFKPSYNQTGIFHRYQLLSPGLISTLGITFLLVTPLVLLVVGALASIKSPFRTEGLKQAHDKKNQ